jgi:hypothetical protein
MRRLTLSRPKRPSGEPERPPAKVPVLTEASEYTGQDTIAVSCTQLGTDYSAHRAKRVVDEWIELLGHPTDLKSLRFVSRTPKRLFAALSGQPQLISLFIKWGDYADLRSVECMSGLTTLELNGASAVTDLRPLSNLVNLQSLVVEGFRAVDDTTPLGALVALQRLELGGNWMAPRNGHVPDIRFLSNLTQLQELLLHTLVVDDLDYSPLMALPALRSVRVMKVRGMHPDFEELQKRLPWAY